MFSHATQQIEELPFFGRSGCENSRSDNDRTTLCGATATAKSMTDSHPLWLP